MVSGRLSWQRRQYLYQVRAVGEKGMIRLIVEPIPERGTYKLVQSVIIDGVTLPAGMESNGASVPFYLWPIIGTPFDPRFIGPAFGHDRLYTTGERPRLESDELFKKWLMANKVDAERADAMFTGVRLGGKSHYTKLTWG